jgi:hypothetical protein
MLHSLRLWPLLLLLSVAPALADARMNVLVDVLKLREAAQILSGEGLMYADTLNQDMLNGQGGAGWQQQVQAIYDPIRMVEGVRAELEGAFTDDMLEETIAFFGSSLGTKIINLENSARVAIQDADVENAARGRYTELSASGSERVDAVERYVATGDMLNRNVASALNSNVQFLRGLADGKAIEMSESEILSDVSNDMDATRDDTETWLFGFLLMAYHPLEDAELEAYIAFSDTGAGHALNNALFAGFGAMYEDISYTLGRTVALNMMAEEL